MQKLTTDWQAKVVQAREQAESEAKALASMSVALSENPEHFEAANDLFHHDSLLRQQAVGPPLVGCELAPWRLPVRRGAAGMEMLHALVALVGEKQGVRSQRGRVRLYTRTSCSRPLPRLTASRR